MAKAKRTKQTPQRRQRRRAKRRPRAIEVALGGLAHDIRTPLTGILAMAQLLSSSDLPLRERRWADAIQGAAEHLARLTTVVIDAAKSESAGLVLQHEPFSPRQLAEAVGSSAVGRAEAKGLATDVSIAKNLPALVSGDGIRLRSALENLIDNAVKFTERGRVGFSASAAKAGPGRTRLTFTVKDSGIGLVAADLKRLFRPFTQANEDVARRYGGAGLGLLFVKRIAEAMGGGSLKVMSKPGRGSTFVMSVIVADQARPKRLHRPSAGRATLRVLCIEDNPYGRVVLGTVLRELGHRVSFAGTAQAALDAVLRNEHDVVMMDVALPDTDGLEATRRIRGLPKPAGAVPIIGVSGHTDPADIAAAKAAGMDAYLRKPATPAEIDEALRTVATVRRGGSIG